MSIPASTVSAGDGAGNRLIAAMVDADRHLLMAHATRVRMSFGDELTAADQPIEAAFFPQSGVASVVKPDGQGERVEICLIGREGFSGAALVSGDGRWPYRTFVQTPELAAWRVEAGALEQCLEQSASLRRVLTRATYSLFIQVAEGLVSAAGQKLEARLARWLLMYRDRLESDRIEVTHDFMARMVASQRTGVTSALHAMEGAGLIRSTRGTTMIVDPAGLKALADGGYGIAEVEAARVGR